MLATNQQYNGFAGDRLWTAPYGRELWGKPLVNHSAAVVLFNRDGEVNLDLCSLHRSRSGPIAVFEPNTRWHLSGQCGVFA